MQLVLDLRDRIDRVAQRGAGREVEGNGDDGKLALVIDGDGDARFPSSRVNAVNGDGPPAVWM